MAEVPHYLKTKLERSPVWRYTLALLCIALALLLHIGFVGTVFRPTGVFLASIVAAAWFGGAGPGFLAALLATFIVDGYVPGRDSFTAADLDLPRFLTFVTTGLAVGWGTNFRRRAEAALRHSELALRKSHDELEMKVAEKTAELRRSQAYLAEAQSLTHTGSWGWRVATREVTHWSEECFRLYGFDPKSGLPSLEQWTDRVHPEDRDKRRQTVRRAIMEKADYTLEYRVVLPDGATRHVHSVAHAIFDSAGELVEFVGTAMDVTERKRAQETLRKMQVELAHVARIATLGELTASIAHEINQPLAAIVNNASACLRWLTGQNIEEGRRSAALVIEDGHRAGEIIKRIRSFAKKAPAPKERIDINQTIREVIAFATMELETNGISLETRLTDDVHYLPLVSADRIQLQQVILNLIMNAVEAMSSVKEGRRELLIRSDTDDSGAILVDVRDSGPGLACEDLHRLFTPFYTTKPQGMGMGLAICRSIIEAHGGRLWASANEGAGATFHFTLPTDGAETAKRA